MKNINIKFFSVLLFTTIAVILFSCDDKEEFKTSVDGNVSVNPNIAKNGDILNLSISGFSSSSYGTINGKETYPIVHYLIDGNEVVTSEEKSVPFNAVYKIKNLSIGQHVVSINITSPNDFDYYDNQISNAILTVIE